MKSCNAISRVRLVGSRTFKLYRRTLVLGTRSVVPVFRRFSTATISPAYARRVNKSDTHPGEGVSKTLVFFVTWSRTTRRRTLRKCRRRLKCPLRIPAGHHTEHERPDARFLSPSPVKSHRIPRVYQRVIIDRYSVLRFERSVNLSR